MIVMDGHKNRVELLETVKDGLRIERTMVAKVARIGELTCIIYRSFGSPTEE